MNISIELVNPRWVNVFTIPKGTVLQKGSTDFNKSLKRQVAQVRDRFVCYSWRTSDEVLYCGSVARDYQNRSYSTNLEGRLSNYLENHNEQPSGRINSNLMVFNNINLVLQTQDVNLSILEFDYLLLDERKYSCDVFKENSEIVHAIEGLIICHYKEIGQSKWNRTSPTANSIKKLQTKQIQKPGTSSKADKIRMYVAESRIFPARAEGLSQIQFKSGEIHKEMKLINSMPSVCEAIDSRKFADTYDLYLYSRIGPKRSSTVLWTFNIIIAGGESK